MGIGASTDTKGGSRPRSTSLALKQMDTKLYLPVEIVFNILRWLPARFLHNQGRFVCKTWANIIRDPKFIESHTLAQLAKSNEEEIEAAELERMLDGSHILARSMGVLLLQSKSNNRHLSVVNPVTRKITELPRLSHKCWRACLGYVPATGEIKVICHVPGRLCALTVGCNMAWRMIDVEPNLTLPQLSCEALFFSLDGVVFYWFACVRDRKMKLYAVDLGDESIHHVNFPDQFVDRIVSTGKYVLLPHNGRTIFEPVTTAWKLKDFRKSEWEECDIIEIKRRPTFRPLFYDFSANKNTLISW